MFLPAIKGVPTPSRPEVLQFYGDTGRDSPRDRQADWQQQGHILQEHQPQSLLATRSEPYDG